MFYVFRLLIHMVAILIISYLLPGVIKVDSVLAALVAALVKGFHVNGFWGAVFGSILISLVSWILSRFLP